MTSAETQVAVVAVDALEEFGKLKIGVERATAVANELRAIVDEKGLAVPMGKSGEHLRVEAWITTGAFCGITPQTEWTQELRHPVTGDLEGYKARVQSIRLATGEAIGAAESSCHFDEQLKRYDGTLFDRWMEYGRPNRHACMSMAQTRATSKALAQVLRWIPVLAGYSGTPFEEMPPEDREPQHSEPPNTAPREAAPPQAAPSKGGMISKAQAKPLWVASFKASESVHGDDEKHKFKCMDWVIQDQLGYEKLYQTPASEIEKVKALIAEYAQLPSTDDVPF
jgi:hypothetical protein